MSAFFVGQRVRIVGVSNPNGANGRRLLGREAIITGKSICFDWNAYVVGIGSRGVRGGLFAFFEHQLEPILPSGHQPAEMTVEELLPFLKTREVV